MAVKVIMIVGSCIHPISELEHFSISAVLNDQFDLPLTHPDEDHADCPQGVTVECSGNIIAIHEEEEASIYYVLQ